MDNNPIFSTTPIVLNTTQSKFFFLINSPLQGSSLHLIVPSSLNQPHSMSQLSMRGVSFTPRQISIPTTLAAYMWTPSYLLGHPILPSTNVMSTTATKGPITSGLLILFTNQMSNPLVITQPTQPMYLQVGTSVISSPGGLNPSLGPNPLTLGENPTMGQKFLMGQNPIMEQTPTFGQIVPWPKTPLWGNL